jgi:hypothetical protein
MDDQSPRLRTPQDDGVSLMKRALMLTVLACGLLARGPSPRTDAVEAPASPPLPSPTVPPGADRPSPIPLPLAIPDRGPVEGQAKGKPAKKKPAAPKIRLGEKHETDTPTGHGPGQIPAGKIQVKADGGKLKAVLTASASSHCFFGIPSTSVESLQLVQEFEIVPGDEGDPRVEISLSGKLDGYVRSELRSSASLRLADASVYPACGGPSLWLAFPPCCASGTSSARCEQETRSPPLTVTTGRYVLVMNLVLETTAANLFRGHAEAVFAPGRQPGRWTSPIENPFEDVEADDFGLTVLLRTASPPRAD